MATEADQYYQQVENVSAVYNIYRITLPMVLLITYFGSGGTGILGILAPALFIVAASTYTLIGVVAALVYKYRPGLSAKTNYQFAVLLIDVISIVLIVFSSGGVLSGLALLLLVTIFSASILLRGPKSTFIAATASLAILYCELYLSFSLEDYTNQFIQAGVLGVMMFATSIYIQSMNNRAYQAAALSEEQASSIVDLEKLNDEIIQRMRTGILVVNSKDEVISINNAARSLLSPILKMELVDNKERFLLPKELKQQISEWRSNPYNQSNPIEIPNSNTRLQANFAFLNKEEDSDILVFVENQLRMMQRIRQTKLASLGKLTANIAHEVRNPLGAISHAGQILNESETITDEDRRLLDIILNHSGRVNRIIEDVLDASRHKDMDSSTVQLGAWLGKFITHYKNSSDNCDEIQFEIEPQDIELQVSPSQLERILTNLFDNGLRYSEKAIGKATLFVTAGLKSGVDGGVQPVIRVIDMGPGLSEEEESHLFEPFHTTESTGTGLGLYISKELCEANQATLDYSVTKTGTSCFSIYFSNPRLKKHDAPTLVNPTQVIN